VTETSQQTIQGENVIFFPTAARWDSSRGNWEIPVHGWIFQPEASSKVQRASYTLFRRYLKFKVREELNPLFRERAQAFFYVNVRNRQLRITSAGTETLSSKSVGHGHFAGMIRVPGDLASKLQTEDGWLQLEAEDPQLSNSPHFGRALLVPERGISVISDIDDTIKHSEVRDRKQLLANTFLREFRAVPETAEVYRIWQQAGAMFHYVSSSPWQLFQPLERFLEEQQFPTGTIHLRMLRLRDARLIRIFSSRSESKARAIEDLLKNYPQRKFIFVGDSGERDPEIYGTLARRYSNQVLHTFIREVPWHRQLQDRFAKAFRGVPAENWTLFRTIGPIRERMESMLKLESV